jgi:hypothetical protein
MSFRAPQFLVLFYFVVYPTHGCIPTEPVAEGFTTTTTLATTTTYRIHASSYYLPSDIPKVPFFSLSSRMDLFGLDRSLLHRPHGKMFAAKLCGPPPLYTSFQASL